MYNKIRACRGVKKSGLSRLEVPRNSEQFGYTECKEWITVDTPTEIKDKLRRHNQHHFGQADGTFPTVPPFSEWVDWGASSHTADLILDGNLLDDSVSEIAQDLLKYMEKKTILDEVKAELTQEEWEGKIKNWPKNTSTSPSGFHLTHSKALIAKHDLKIDTPEGEKLEIMRQQLINWQVRLLNVAINNKHSFKRWQTVVNVMILKEEGNIKINKTQGDTSV